jgi:hypothetical protein
MRYLGPNLARSSLVTADRAFETTNNTHENTGDGNNFWSANSKFDSVSKPLYLSGILAWRRSQKRSIFEGQRMN